VPTLLSHNALCAVHPHLQRNFLPCAPNRWIDGGYFIYASALLPSSRPGKANFHLLSTATSFRHQRLLNSIAPDRQKNVKGKKNTLVNFLY
ncbi:MAG: hypothetical protein AB1556_03000, partial [Bacillota bacterium]